ncbi:MAG: metallophosphoesterase [Chloroflexi bacterium]|nr:metallophosphoesterase [Chloroflexota bacterium]
MPTPDQRNPSRIRLPWLAGLTVTLAGVGAVRAAYRHMRRHDAFDLNETHLVLRRLPPAFDGYKIVHFSDVHLGSRASRMSRARLQAAADLINQQQPDLIAFTGDLITRRAPVDLNELIVPLREMSARDGKVAVLGNHDYYVNRTLIDAVFRLSDFTHLSNDVLTLHRDDARLHIAGVDSLMRRRARLDRVLRRLPNRGGAILLAHEPDFADFSAATQRFDLQLSGHSHGGQINVPVLTRLALPNYGQRYPGGLTLVGNMLVYTNRGLGTVGLPLRINSRPEITVINLYARRRRWG